ncbi:MAG TPA: hypothetical protein VLC94_10955 [Candidatus Acidoferrum sp.]|nr:hypothetical protein [Candidatus Acidoferrum sp.]
MKKLATALGAALCCLSVFLLTAQPSLAETKNSHVAVAAGATTQPLAAHLNLSLARVPFSPGIAWQTVSPATSATSSLAPSEHRFWDRENIVLFSLVGASRALDYSSTLNMRRRGRQEIFLTNDVVDNHPAFAAIEAAGTAVSIGASYLFHRYHHHRLERWTSIVHASLSTTGAVRNYCLKTAHPSTTP